MPDARWLTSARETILMQAKNTVGASAPKAGFKAFREALHLLAPASWMRAMAMPLAALALVVVSAGTGSLAVAAAQKTLPGDALYDVKLLAERVTLRLTDRDARTERRVEIAGRRLEEMFRVSSMIDPSKEDRIARLSGLFTEQMHAVRAELSSYAQSEDADTAIRVALATDAKADEYRRLFTGGTLLGRPALRMALISLDQASVTALEILVGKQAIASNVLPEAQLTSTVGKRIEAFEAHVAAAAADEDAPIPSKKRILAARAKEAVDEARDLLTQGDFKAAVLKVSEGAELVSEAESLDPTASATSTDETAPAEDAPPPGPAPEEAATGTEASPQETNDTP